MDTNPNSTTFGLPTSVRPVQTRCNHYSQEEIKQIPHITKNVKAALDFLSKDDDGFFLMYEQGDVSSKTCGSSRYSLTHSLTILTHHTRTTTTRLTKQHMPTIWMTCWVPYLTLMTRFKLF